MGKSAREKRERSNELDSLERGEKRNTLRHRLTCQEYLYTSVSKGRVFVFLWGTFCFAVAIICCLQTVSVTMSVCVNVSVCDESKYECVHVYM